MHARHEAKASKYLPKDYNNVQNFLAKPAIWQRRINVDPPTHRPELVIETTGRSNLASGIYRNFTE
jgi:hypothetical protein